METGGGDDSEKGLMMMTKKGKKINDRYRCQPHPRLQGYG